MEKSFQINSSLSLKDFYSISTFYAPPKIKKVAIISYVRNMVEILNSMLRYDVMWDENLAKI